MEEYFTSRIQLQHEQHCWRVYSLLITPPSHRHHYSHYLTLRCCRSTPSTRDRVEYLTKSERSTVQDLSMSFTSPASHLPTSNHDEPHSHPHQQQITKPLPIRTAALLGTPVLSGTPELVRGLRQFYLTANAGLSFGCSWLCSAWYRPSRYLAEIGFATWTAHLTVESLKASRIIPLFYSSSLSTRGFPNH
jgi:hypothetical protein